MSKEERIERVSKNAGLLEIKTYNCAQGTLAALIDEFMPGYEGRAELVKAASLMPSSGGLNGTCGALNGAIMFFGIYYGIDNTNVTLSPEEMATYVENMSICTKFGEAFKTRWGSIMCNDIHPQIVGEQFDLLTSEGREAFAAAGSNEKCAALPEYAAKTVAELIL